MTPLDYGEGWVHPARTVNQARCKLGQCTQDGLPGNLVMAVTLSERGWCTQCERSADTSHQELRLGMEA